MVVDFTEHVAVDLEEPLALVAEAGEGGGGEEGEEIEVEGRGGGFGWGGAGEEDLGAVGVVELALLGVGEDLVGVLELLEGGGGGGGVLVGVELEGEAAVGGADLLGRAVAGDVEDLVEAPLLWVRHWERIVRVCVV